MQLITYTNDSDGVSLVIVAPECGLSLEEIAAKDIPLLNDEPRPYLILDDSELPDRAFREQWRIIDGAVIIDSSIQIPSAIREIDARRLQLALYRLNLFDTVNTAIATLGVEAQIEWNKAAIIREDSPLVIAMVSNLGLDIDAILAVAYSLV